MFDGYLTRSQAARHLGVGVTRVRQLEQQRILYPHRDWKGVHRFDPDDVEALRRERSRKGCKNPDDLPDEEPPGRDSRKAGRLRCPHCGRRLRVRIE